MSEPHLNPISSGLQDKNAWLITSDYIGQRAISVGIAEALGVSYEEKLIEPPKLWRSLAPWAGVAPSEKIGQPSSQHFAQPWPDIAIGVGRQSVAYLQKLRKLSQGKIFTVMLQDPKVGTKAADFIWVPEHDSLRGENVFTTLISPHKYSPNRIEALRESPLEQIKNLPGPRISLIIGGDSKAFHYSPENIEKLIQAVRSLKSFAGSFLVTCSRRTPKALEQALEEVTQDTPRFFWDGTGYNPYGDFLAYADYLVVTADSVNMVGEASVTGKPIYVFFPEGGGSRIDYFHRKLQERGITKALPEQFTSLESWDYPPQYSAYEISEAILQKWQTR